MVFVKLLIVLAICLNLHAVAFAHPAGTDSDGGHINHNTGEYHYHHGYSAHQHSDLDGDGDLDCPYQFVDRTDSSSGEAKPTDADDFWALVGKYKAEQAEVPPTSKPENEATNKAIKDYFIPIILCFVPYGVLLVVDAIKSRFKK